MHAGIDVSVHVGCQNNVILSTDNSMIVVQLVTRQCHDHSMLPPKKNALQNAIMPSSCQVRATVF